MNMDVKRESRRQQKSAKRSKRQETEKIMTRVRRKGKINRNETRKTEEKSDK